MGFWDSAEGREYAEQHADQLSGSAPPEPPKKTLIEQVLDGDKDLIEAIGEAVLEDGGEGTG
jgi:hypothetical protein